MVVVNILGGGLFDERPTTRLESGAFSFDDVVGVSTESVAKAAENVVAEAFRPGTKHSSPFELQSRAHACKGRGMNKRLIWVDGDDFTGWCCSRCNWGVIAPRLESTAATLAFNRVTQESFEKHDCTGSTHGRF